jgi:hypothetical protein
MRYVCTETFSFHSAGLTVIQKVAVYQRRLRLTPCRSFYSKKSTVPQTAKKYAAFYYLIHNSPPLHPTLSQMNPVHTLFPSRSIVILSFHLCLDLPSGLLDSGVLFSSQRMLLYSHITEYSLKGVGLCK